MLNLRLLWWCSAGVVCGTARTRKDETYDDDHALSLAVWTLPVLMFPFGFVAVAIALVVLPAVCTAPCSGGWPAADRVAWPLRPRCVASAWRRVELAR